FANGGRMAYRLACELSDRIAAIASVSGALVATPCHPARPVSVLEMHGADDPLIPIGGGSVAGLGSFAPTLTTLQRWARLDACGGTPTVTENGITTISTWNGCSARVHVVLEVIKGAGHSWFGPADYLAGEPDANEAVWDFFSQAPART